jgi:hypothetical protein
VLSVVQTMVQGKASRDKKEGLVSDIAS